MYPANTDLHICKIDPKMTTYFHSRNPQEHTAKTVCKRKRLHRLLYYYRECILLIRLNAAPLLVARWAKIPSDCVYLKVWDFTKK